MEIKKKTPLGNSESSAKKPELYELKKENINNTSLRFLIESQKFNVMGSYISTKKLLLLL